MYRKLLVPTDGSVLATKAINHAIGLGRETGATLTIVTVTDMWSPWEMARNARSRHAAPVEDFEEKATANAKMVLEDARRLVEELVVERLEADTDLGSRHCRFP